MPNSAQDKQRELDELEQRAARLKGELGAEEAAQPFQPHGYYTAYFATTGFMLGIFGAMSSLLLNIVGSSLVDKNPLQLIQVYLTFPLGDKALELSSGLALAVGCCLYLGTGMLLGIPVYLALTRWTAGASLAKRLMVASVVSLVIWVIMYYGILSWLQPAVVKNMSPENYIVNRVPWYVAAATHLVFGWTLAIVYPLGDFTAYRRPTEQI
ncbi:MAG: hypothetical protein U0805_06175 [Pirellulales bacterium]